MRQEYIISIFYAKHGLLEFRDIETRPIFSARGPTALLPVEGVAALHDLHVWMITSGFETLSVHTCVKRPNRDLVLGYLLATLWDHFTLEHATIQSRRAPGARAARTSTRSPFAPSLSSPGYSASALRAPRRVMVPKRVDRSPQWATATNPADSRISGSLPRTFSAVLSKPSRI